MRIFFACIALLLISTTPRAQTANYIKGKVLDEDGGKPVPGASVFISNSTRGTISRADGSFELTAVPAGRHDLVISSIGYTTIVHSYGPGDLPLLLEVRMKAKISELASVTVEPDEKNGWEKWGRFFIENFIGTSANAADCQLKNPEVLRFKHSRKKGTLTVIADAPLVVENRALGYNLQYQLEEFQYNFKSHLFIYLGYPLFEDMAARRQNQQRRWANKREAAYNGSVQHFFRSLYHDSLAANGFEARRLIKTPNLEKQRVRAAMQASVRKQQEQKGQRVVISFGDSTEYYNSVMRQPDEFETVLRPLLTADSLLAPADGDNKTFFFRDYLSIQYKKEKEEPAYLKYLSESRPPYYQRSSVYLADMVSLLVDSQGHYTPVLGLVTYGYWGWSEKIANMLPLDYEPGRD